MLICLLLPVLQQKLQCKVFRSRHGCEINSPITCSWTNSRLAEWNNCTCAIFFIYFKNHRYLEVLSIIFSMVDVCNALPSRATFSCREKTFALQKTQNEGSVTVLRHSVAGCLFSSQLAASCDISFPVSTERSS